MRSSFKNFIPVVSFWIFKESLVRCIFAFECVAFCMGNSLVVFRIPQSASERKNMLNLNGVVIENICARN